MSPETIAQLSDAGIRFLLAVMLAIATPLGTYIGVRFYQFLRTQLGDKNASFAIRVVQQAVLMAERLDQDGKGKKAIASSFAENMAKRYGVAIDPDLLSNLIEASVTLLHEGAFSGGQPLQPLLMMGDEMDELSFGTPAETSTARPRFVAE